MAVLIVDDEKNIRDSVVKFLELEQIEARAAENGLSAQRLLSEEPFEAAVVDLRMPGMNGLELLKWIAKEGPDIPVIMISAFGEISDAVEAMKLGARDYVVKPFDPEELVLRLKRLIEEKKNSDRVKSIRKSSKNEWIFTSPASVAVKKLIEKVADSPSTILLTGESGTGKEVSAQMLHALSGRRNGAFLPINIGGIPENLLESELFGHEKGAFTGAFERKIGLAELASGGTLFLDEIGEMPMALQVKLLRFLQDKKILRLGGMKPIPIDVRIIAATNKNLEEMVANKEFREDLYFRLNVIAITLPPLRERKEDIPALTGHFIEKFNRTLGRGIKEISPEALNLLMSYSFPGNIRELENILERAVILAESPVLKEKDFNLPIARVSTQGNKKGKFKEMEKEAIEEALNRWEGNRTRAAEELGITRRTLFNKMKEYGIEL